MEKKVNPYSKMNGELLGWMADCDDGVTKEADALIEVIRGLSAPQLRFLRGHGVRIWEGQENRIIQTMRDIKPDQILCLAAKPYVVGISLSGEMMPAEKVGEIPLTLALSPRRGDHSII